jgi:hypothetical protein
MAGVVAAVVGVLKLRSQVPGCRGAAEFVVPGNALVRCPRRQLSMEMAYAGTCLGKKLKLRTAKVSGTTDLVTTLAVTGLAHGARVTGLRSSAARGPPGSYSVAMGSFQGPDPSPPAALLVSGYCCGARNTVSTDTLARASLGGRAVIFTVIIPHADLRPNSRAVGRVGMDTLAESVAAEILRRNWRRMLPQCLATPAAVLRQSSKRRVARIARRHSTQLPHRDMVGCAFNDGPGPQGCLPARRKQRGLSWPRSSLPAPPVRRNSQHLAPPMTYRSTGRTVEQVE